MGLKLPSVLLTYLICVFALLISTATGTAQSAGSVAGDYTAGIVINEILYSPGVISDSEQRASTSVGEFIELINATEGNINISGWTLSNRSEIKFTFPEGTIIPAGESFVVAEKMSNTGSIPAYLFSAGLLGLNDKGDEVILSDEAGKIISSVTYEGLKNGTSITRNPDLTGSFEGHETADINHDRSPFSPGTKIDGSAFGSSYAIGLQGNAGWHLVATPTQNTSFRDLFSGIWTQGIPGSDAPSVSAASANIYRYAEPKGGRYEVIADMNEKLKPGYAYLIYFYEDNDYRSEGIQGGFPKLITSDKQENSSPVQVRVTASDADGNGLIDDSEGYTLIGNPYGVPLSAKAVMAVFEGVSFEFNRNLYVWNPSHGNDNGAFTTLSEHDVIAPFQPFFVRFTSTGVNETVDLVRRRLELKDQYRPERADGEDADVKSKPSLEMRLGNSKIFDTYNIHFSHNGEFGEDRFDGYKLFSLNREAINFYSVSGNEILISKNMLPSSSTLKPGEELRITLGYSIPAAGEYELKWDLSAQFPENMELFLLDNETGREVNLKTSNSYNVYLTKKKKPETDRMNETAPVISRYTYMQENNGRFELKIRRARRQVTQQESMDKPVVLSPNYPNPFGTQTRMDLDLKESMKVKVTIWNIVGQQVATMHDGMMEAGQDHPLIWDVPANMPSGIYICKVEAGGTVITRKMTLVK